jgi:hypothetical protein
MRALEIPVIRWERDLIRLPKEASVLLVAGPRIPPERGEIPALMEWVRGGGTLVVATPPPNPFLEPFGLRPGRVSTQERGEIRPVLPGPYTREVASVSFCSRGLPALLPSRPTSVIHATGPSGAALVVTEWGRGRVIALASSEVFSNQRLREADHARLALRLLLHHRGEGKLLVDEYHHGYGRVSSVGHYLGRSALFPPLVQAGFVALLFVALRGRRFGVPRPLSEPPRQSSMDYVRSMGGLMGRVRAAGPALALLVQWIREEARKMNVEGHRGLQAALRSAHERSGEQGIAEEEVLGRVRGLYRILDQARRTRTEGRG